jgi:AcrR family transcriptional regulator
MKNAKKKAGKNRIKIHTNVKDEALVKIRREQISKAAMQAFAENGFHETNLRQITKLSGLAYGSIYNYVKTKDDILYIICDSILSDLFRRIDEAVKTNSDPVDQIEAIIRATTDHADEHKDAVLLIWEESKVLKSSGWLPEIVEKERTYLKIIAEVLERGSRLGVFNIPEGEIPILVNILPLTSSTWALRRWNLGMISRTEYTEALIDFVLQGIGASRRRNLKSLTAAPKRKRA